MKVIRRILFWALTVVDIYLLYAWVGYLVLGLDHPIIYGVENTTFTGMYMMSITFFVCFAVVTTILIISMVKFFKKRRNG